MKTEEEIVKDVCEIMNVHYSHYDNHKMGADYFHRHRPLKSQPKIVVYSSMQGRWQFAILEDMTIHTENLELNKIICQLKNKVDEMTKEQIENNDIADVLEEERRISLAENYLKENNCTSVINNPKKKINWM